jgi:hypothetical protein
LIGFSRWLDHVAIRVEAAAYRFGVSLKISATANIVETKPARLAAAVQWQWNIATAPPEKKARPPGAGDVGKRLQTARLA